MKKMLLISLVITYVNLVAQPYGVPIGGTVTNAINYNPSNPVYVGADPYQGLPDGSRRIRRTRSAKFNRVQRADTNNCR
ncbi:hypothetical protein M1446_00800 [Candidatus Dependentiae bacterium]|nr:hypothetical protein [Candidatus Dependentiae bacterium]